MGFRAGAGRALGPFADPVRAFNLRRLYMVRTMETALRALAALITPDVAL